MAAKPVVAIVGQTASGKSSLAIEIAQKWRGEIIAADSRTIYKGMDIGTAKLQKQEMQGINHFGLDLVDPSEDYSVVKFKAYAESKISEIRSRGNLPIIVGGTGLYVDAVLYDFQFEAINKDKISRLEDKNITELQKLARKIDENISKSMLHNKRHLINFIARGGHAKKPYSPKNNIVIAGLFPSKSRLRNNINERVEHMFKQGLRKEVAELVEQFGWNCEAMSGIGYSEFREYYDGEISMSKVKRNIVQNTLHYAKRQKTWFKRNPYLHRFEDIENAKKYINTKLKQQLTL